MCVYHECFIEIVITASLAFKFTFFFVITISVLSVTYLQLLRAHSSLVSCFYVVVIFPSYVLFTKNRVFVFAVRGLFLLFCIRYRQSFVKRVKSTKKD